jgi:hypothetical protein
VIIYRKERNKKERRRRRREEEERGKEGKQLSRPEFPTNSG